MHISTTYTAGFLAGILAYGHGAFAAPPACPTAPIEGPFSLTIVHQSATNGTTEFPATVAVVSRGAEILSSGLSYGQQFTFDTATNRIFEGDKPAMGNADIEIGSPFLFTSESGDWGLEQVTVNCATYLVKAGTAADGVYAWWSEPTTGLPKGVEWQGAGTTKAVAALRLDVEIPTRR